MKGSIRHIFTNAIIILMTVFVCLPCSVKREIKQALDIPVAHLDKPNKTIVCFSFTKADTQKSSVSCHKKDTPKIDYNYSFTFFSFSILKHSASSFSEIRLVASVPIYILHEQYLI